MAIESIITKIKKLFELAEGNANENERNRALEMVQELLSKHNLDMVQIQSATLDQKPDEVVGDTKLEPWTRAVLAAMCALYYTTLCNFTCF